MEIVSLVLIQMEVLIMDNNDTQLLKDCIMFVLDNDTDLDEQDVKNLWNLNTKLLLKECN